MKKIYLCFVVLIFAAPVALMAQSDSINSENVVQVRNDEPAMDELVFYTEEAYPLNMNELKTLIGYPSDAKEEIEGKVIIRLLIDENGKYVRHVVLKDPHPILTNAVTSKIDRLVFSPSKIEGKPVKSWVTIPFQFKLM